MYLGPNSNLDRRFSYNTRSPSSPMATKLSYNGLSNLQESATESSDGVSPFSSNSLSGNGSSFDSGVSIVHGTHDLRLGLSRHPPLGFIQPRAFEDEVHNLRDINTKLEIKIQMLQAQHDTLREAYSALLKAIPGANKTVAQDARASLTFPDIVPLNQEDYPNVKFWFKRHWIEFLNDQVTDITFPSGTQSRGRARASQNVNVAMRYVEMNDGNPIDGDRASEIRKFARAIWVSFGKRGRAPAKWGQADVETRKEYCQEMNSRFPELRFCDLDWKSEQVATDNYPSWYTTWASRRKEWKEENEEDMTNKGAQSKRPRKPSTQSALKRKKVENQTEGDDVGGLCASEATMESDIVIVSTNIPTITGNTQINVSMDVSSDNKSLLADTFKLDPLGTVPQDPAVVQTVPQVAQTDLELNFIPTIVVSDDADRVTSSSSNPSTSVSKDFQITTSVRLPDAFSEKINGLCASSAHTMPTLASSAQPTTPSIQETALDVNSMADSSALPSESFVAPGNYNFNSMANSGALPSESMVASGNHETTLGVNSMANSSNLPQASESKVAPSNYNFNSIANTSSLPSESMVASNHGTAFGVSSMANSSALPSKSIAAPIPGAAKKSSKMRPGTTNTARSLCSQEWCKQNPRGTTIEFKNFFDNLSPEALKRYEDLSVEKKRRAGTATTGPDVMHV